MAAAEDSTVKAETLFTCSLCGLSENYDYKGKHPPFSKQIKFTNDCYVMKDPFSPPKRGQFLILGGDCCLCSNAFCQSSGCSLFYEQFYCLPCAERNISRFPQQVHSRLKKAKNKQDT